MSKTFLADVSEFQPGLDEAAYLAWSQAIIIRALYGTRTDTAWYGGQRRAALHAGGARFLGIYQYLTQDQDAAAQARALAALLGPLLPGEQLICDLEEGTGCEARWQQWRDTILAAYPQLRDTPAGGPWLYSGEDFAAANGLAPQWIAAYSGPEPAAPHILWQFTDAYDVPGAGPAVDCSLYHGTLGELAALITPTTPAAVTAPPGLDQEGPVMLLLPKGTPTPVAVPAGATSIRFTTVFGASGAFPAAALSVNWHGTPTPVTVTVDPAEVWPVLAIPPGVEGICIYREDDGSHYVSAAIY